MGWVIDPVTGERTWVDQGEIPVGTGDPPPTPDAPHTEFVYGPNGEVVGIIRAGKHEVPLPTPGFPPSPGDVSRGQSFRLSRLAGAVLPEGGIIPIVYGQMRVEAQQFAYKPYLPTGNPVYGGYAICAGPIDSIVTTRVNGYPYTGLSPVAVTTYLGTSAGNSNINLPTDPDGYLLLHPYLAWAFVELWSTGTEWDLTSLAFDVKGRKVLDFRTSTTAWSDNPILCLYDLLTDKDFGAGLPASLFDTGVGGTWRSAADACDAVVDGAARYKLNVALGRGMTVQAAIDAIRAVCAADLYFHRGLLKVYVDGLRPVAALTLTEGDNCRNVVLTQTPPADLPNAVVIDFPDAAKEYVSSTVTVETDALVAGTEPRREARYQLEGSTSETQSTRIGRLYLRRTNFAPRRIALIAGPDAEELLIGDRIDVNAASCGLAAQPFVVEGLQRVDAGEWAIDGREYDAAVYSDEAIATDTPPSLSEPSPFDTPPDVNLVSWAEGYRYSSWSTRIWWPAPFALKSATLYSSGWTAFGNAYVNAYVNDGDLVTAGAGFTNPQNPTGSGFKLDLGSGVTKTFVGLRATPVAGTDGSPWLLKVSYSDDNITYTDVSSEVHGTDWIGWESVGAHRYWKLTLVYPNGASSPCDFAELQFYETDQLFPWVAGYQVRRASTGDLLLWVPASARPTAASPLDVTPFLTTGQQSGYATVTYDLLIHVVSEIGLRSTGRETGKTTFATAAGTQFNVATHVQSGTAPTVAQTGSDALTGTRKGAVIHGTTEVRTDGRLSVKHLQKNMTGLGTSFNDFDPGAACVILGLHTLDGNITITGIDSTDFDDAVLCVVNEDGGTSTVTLKHMSTSSLAGNRMDLAEDSDLVLAVGDAAWLNWDSAIGRWVGLTNQKGTGSLTVKESDGSPSVANVTEIRVSGATVTDEGGGAVTITVTAGAGGVSLLTDEFTGAGTATQVCDLSANLATSDAESVVGVYYDGVLQPTTGWSVTDANTITLDPGPVSGVAIAITFYATLPTGVTGVHVEADAGDGSTTDFPLANTAIANGLVGGYVDGVRQSGTTLIDGGTKARYATAPTDGTVVETVVLY